EVDLQTRALARWACCLRMNAAGWIPRGHWRFAQPDRGHAVTLKAILGGGRSAGIRRTRVSWQVRAEERRWLKRRAPLLHRRALRDEARVPGEMSPTRACVVERATAHGRNRSADRIAPAERGH